MDIFLGQEYQLKVSNDVGMHQEEGKNSKRDAPLCFLSSGIYFPSPLEEIHAIFPETYTKSQFFYSDILSEEFDVLFEEGQEFSLPSPSEEHFDNFQKLLQSGQFCYRKLIT